MGKHESGYLYPTPAWVVEALAEHIGLAGKVVWECAAGTGTMTEALKAAGASRVYCTDISTHD
jgi:predicted RNA methylase